MDEKAKHRARAITTKAIREGRIKRMPCEVCGDPRSHAHHRDYRDPFDVQFLCAKHHRLAHVVPIEERQDQELTSGAKQYRFFAMMDAIGIKHSQLAARMRLTSYVYSRTRGGQTRLTKDFMERAYEAVKEMGMRREDGEPFGEAELFEKIDA